MRFDIKKAVPSELNVPLVQSGALTANPRVPEIGKRVCSIRIHGHDSFLANSRTGSRRLRYVPWSSVRKVFR